MFSSAVGSADTIVSIPVNPPPIIAGRVGAPDEVREPNPFPKNQHFKTRR